MPGNPLVRFDEGRVGRTARCRPLSYSTVIIVFQSVDDSRDAVFDQRHLEVDQQAKPLVGEPEIGEKLLLVDREKQLDGFDLGVATLERRPNTHKFNQLRPLSLSLAIA